MRRRRNGRAYAGLEMVEKRDASGVVRYYFAHARVSEAGAILMDPASRQHAFQLISRTVRPGHEARIPPQHPGRHTLPRVGLGFPEGGPMEWRAAGASVMIAPGEYGLFDVQRAFEVRTIPQAYVTHRMFVFFAGDFVEEVWRQVFARAGAAAPAWEFGRGRRDAQLDTLLRLLYQESTHADGPAWLRADVLAREILVWLYLHHPHERSREIAHPVLQPVHDPAVQAALDYLRHHHAERAPAGRVAREVGLGSSALVRRMKAEIGLTPVEYLQRVRLERAKALLAQSHLTVAEICAEVGYENASHFGRFFRLATGRSPLRFRMALSDTTESAQTSRNSA